MKSYSIKAGYHHKSRTDVPPHEVGYWNRARVRSSYYYQYAVYRLAADVIRERGSQVILDVGCGPGTKLAMLSKEFPTRTCVGIDLPEAIEWCRREHPSCTWQVADLNALPEAGMQPKPDLVICSDVIEHLNDPDLLLERVRSYLSAEGRFILSTPERDLLHGPGSTRATNAYHVREWNSAELQDYLRSAGFAVERHELQLPVRFWPNSIFYDEIVRRALKGKKLKYNQVLLLRKI